MTSVPNRDLRQLLEAADRSAPRPALRHVSLARLEERLRRRRLRAAGVAFSLITLLAVLFLMRPPSPSAVPQASTAAALRLQAELQLLSESIAEMRRGLDSPDWVRVEAACDRAQLAVERSAMASYSYGRRRIDAGDTGGYRHLERLARLCPDTRGARNAADEVAARSER